MITFQPKPFNCFFLKGFLSGMIGNFAQNSISSFKDTTGKEITFQSHGIFASKSLTCTLCHQFNRKGRQEVRERVERSSADIRKEYIDRTNVFRGCSESLMISVAIKSTSREVIHQNQNWHCWVLPKGKIWKLCVPHNLMLPSTVLAKNPNLLQYTEVANCKSFHNVYSTSHQAPKTTRQHLGTTSKALKVSSSFFEICIF